jgi:hypothetical protein
MYLVAIAWIYVALMMAVAEATNSNGTVLGAIVTFVLYGLIPVGIVVYLMGSPARRRANKAQERAQWEAQQALAARAAEASLLEPDASGHAPGAAEVASVAPVRKEL